MRLVAGPSDVRVNATHAHQACTGKVGGRGAEVEEEKKNEEEEEEEEVGWGVRDP